MAKITLQTRFTKGLEIDGWEVVKRTTKYIVMSSKNSNNYIFLGGSGSVRIGKNKMSSIPMNEIAKQRLLALVKEG